MALTNEQYDRIQREYSRRRVRNLDAREERMQEAFTRIPELKAMEDTTADLALKRARALLAGNREEAERMAAQARQLKEEKEVLLISHGMTPDYLELQYHCPHCKDTGYVDGEKCTCMKRAVIDLLYDQSMIREKLTQENFEHFSYDFFDKNTKDTGTGLSSYDTMRKNVEIAWDFIRSFGERADNLLLMGQAGAGKTFFSNCIAKELLDRYFSVIYLSSSQLFDMLARQTFDREEENGDEMGRYILDCDLLIIDDLGTELNNSFVGSRLFQCINERILRRKSTVISTNLTMNDMLRLYTERVTSRFMGSYQILLFPERDIRLKKKMQEPT